MFKLLTFGACFSAKTHEKYLFLLVGEAQDPRSAKWNCSPWGSRTSWGTLWSRTATHWKVSENIFKIFSFQSDVQKESQGSGSLSEVSWHVISFRNLL